MKFRVITLGIVLFLSSVSSYDKALVMLLEEMQSENRIALVIGNNAYQRPLTILSNTIN
jgi:hypothetical protein